MVRHWKHRPVRARCDTNAKRLCLPHLPAIGDAVRGYPEQRSSAKAGGGRGVSPSYVRVLVNDLRRALDGCGHGDVLVRRRGWSA